MLVLSLLGVFLLQAAQVISGNVNVQVTATDSTMIMADYESGISFIDLYLDGVFVERKTISPPTNTQISIFVVDTKTLVDGSHVLTARAADVAGNIGASAPFPVDVRNIPTDTAPPTVLINSVTPIASLFINGTQVAQGPVPLKYSLLVPRMTPPRDQTFSLEVRK